MEDGDTGSAKSLVIERGPRVIVLSFEDGARNRTRELELEILAADITDVLLCRIILSLLLLLRLGERFISAADSVLLIAEELGGDSISPLFSGAEVGQAELPDVVDALRPNPNILAGFEMDGDVVIRGSSTLERRSPAGPESRLISM